jgi:PepSY-associated TM region
MRVLAALHRWWGVAFCLLFAMWFASGIVMHFVPFPARSAAGGPAADANRAIRSEQDALPIAAAYARSRGLDPSRASARLIDYDQWTVAGEFDSDRPLYRVAVNDGAGTEIYVSSANGDVVLLTTPTMRLANYFGSIAHWIFPTALRHHGEVWRALMWWLSLVATVGASIGVILGIVRLGRGASYQGLQRWHHIFGLIFAPFIFCWIFSGFLTMDDGWLASLATKPVGLFRALHTLDFPLLVSHPWLRTSLIVGLCLCGLAFSLTGVTLAWRRLGSGGAVAQSHASDKSVSPLS